MSKAGYYGSVAVFFCVTWYSSTVVGEFTNPAESTLFMKQYKTAEIPWKYKNVDNVYRVSWFYTRTGQPVQIYAVDSSGPSAPSGQFENRLEHKGKVLEGDATLAIKMFTKQDEGKFECQVLGLTTPSRSVTLKAVVLSNVTAFKLDKNDVIQGDNVTLSCTVTQGQPSPKVEIWKDSNLINESYANDTKQTTIQHEFRNISAESKGKYVCRVTTDGYPSEKDYHIRVKFPPRIDKSVKEQHECKGESMTLNCKADGDPTPNITVIGPDGKNLNTTFEVKTFGIYKCKATNNLGDDYHNITVKEAKEKPGKPRFNECSYKQLIWTSVGTDVKSTLQFKDQHSKGPWKDIMTTVDTSYSPSTNESFSDKKSYKFRVIAENCVDRAISDECLIKGKTPSSEKHSSSSNAGLIAGVVIAVLIVILIIVIIVVIIFKKRSGSNKKRLADENQAMAGKSTSGPQPAPRSTQRYGDLLYGDDEDVNVPPTDTQPPAYAEIDNDDPNAANYSNNVPSWV